MDEPGPPATPARADADAVGVEGVFHTLFDAYPDALIVADIEGRIVLANPSAGKLLGYTVEELTGLGIDDLVPDAIRPRHAQYRREFARAPRARPMGLQTDLLARRKDGSDVIVEIALSPLQDRGHPLVVAAIRDIGAYPRMRQALLRAHYSELLARVGRLAVDTRDPQLLLERVPAAASEALQVELAMVYLLEPSLLELRIAGGVGSLPGEAIGGRIPNRSDSSIGFVLAQGRPVVVPDYRRETRFSVPAAYLRAGLTSALAVPLSDRGRTIGVLVVRSRVARSFGHDEVGFLESLANLLTSGLQRAQSEEALNHAQRLESVGQLTGGIAHDFNNLLTVIQGNLQVLAELPADADDLQRRQLVDAAFRASRRGAELTGKLLAFSRRQVLQPRDIDLAAMLHSLADMLRRTLDQRVRIAVEMPPWSCRCAPTRASSSPRCSTSRSMRAMRCRTAACCASGSSPASSWRRASPPSSATMRRRPTASWRSPIDDSGIGMTAEARERAFEPFFTTKEPGRGTGLGLSTVYGFARQSRGAVTLDSTPGRGTTVTLYLPRPAPERAVPALDAVADWKIPAGLAVLLVEDDAEVRQVMRRFLEALGCAVTEAASGEQAMLLLDAGRRFALLLSDIALGAGMRGTELAARAQAFRPELAVVLMSGYSAELLDADRDSPAAWELVQKPCTREELAGAIARVLGGA
jgi:PAS domain S-box-containing protein